MMMGDRKVKCPKNPETAKTNVFTDCSSLSVTTLAVLLLQEQTSDRTKLGDSFMNGSFAQPRSVTILHSTKIHHSWQPSYLGTGSHKHMRLQRRKFRLNTTSHYCNHAGIEKFAPRIPGVVPVPSCSRPG